MIAADSSRCPVVILLPELIATHIGTSSTFKAVIHSYFDEALESRWSSLTGIIDINDPKFLGSKNIPFPELVVNNVTFEDDGVYEIQVRINDGWCIGNNVTLDTIGVLDLDDPCNSSKECDLLKNLVCSSLSQTCVCNNDSYHRNRACYLRTRLRAIFSSSKTTTSNITVWWNHPYQNADLVQSYNVSLRAFDSSYNFQTSVELQTNYTFESSLLPGYLYFFEITSVVFLNDSADTIFVKTDTVNIVVGVPKVTFPSSEFNIPLLSKLEITATVHNISNIPPTTVIKWQKNDEDINITDSRFIGSTEDLAAPKLVINGVDFNKDHGQYYRCVATNSEGSWTASARINVHEGFEFLEPCNRSEQCNTGKHLICRQNKCLCKNNYYHYNFTCFYKLLPPGQIDRKRSTFSPKQLMLRWERSGHNTFLNYYRVEIDGHQQHTFGSFPKIYWTRQLTPGARYNVTITAVSYGHLNSDSWYGIKESKPYVDWIETDTGDKEGYSYLSFGQRDNLLRGDDKTSAALKSPITIYAGDVLEGGFNFVRIGSNGVIGLGEEFNRISIHDINSKQLKNRHIVCPFWSDLKDDDGYIYYKTYQRGVDAENDLFLGKASKIVNIQFADFPDFKASWLVKATWVNMTLFGATSKECCYRMLGSINNLGPLERSLPSAGTILQYNPFFERRLYTIEDLNAREACCIKTKQCNLFYEVRPIPLCYRRSPFNPALNFGDPHIVTLDGKNYTFNGYGEYTMLKISKDSIQFDLQARTDLATTANGTSINATIFSGFVALDQTGSKLQIEMSQDKTKMLVRVNDRDLTREFGNESYVSLNQNLSVRWENRTLAASFLQTSIILRVSLGVRFLISEVVVDNAYSGFAKGLMGNFDGNATNEFILPNGTLLDENATKIERDIYFNFGQKWLVNEDSLFYYEKGLSYQNYTHPEFQPIFLDEVNRNKLDDAKTKCGSNPSQACIFDYLATGDIALAESSGLEEASAHTDIKILENESPIITGNSSINVEVGKTVYMQFNASDDSTKLPKYNLLKQPESFTLNETTGIAKWTPTSTAVSELSISVIDDLGAESPSIDVSIVLCKGCGSNGRCSYDNIIPSENDRYSLAVCVCDIGYSGENCEMDTNACLNEPCPLQRNCTDLTPEEEIRFGRGYNCTDCPKGYNDVNDKCEDIDECSEKTSGCEQICNNTYGSFECLCFPGFSLNSNNATCSSTDENSCDSIQRSCEYTCDPIEEKCICPIGFQLAEDGQGCQECEEPYFGEDCSQICTCGQGMERCDPVTGCFCKRGWTGTNCTVDINECENDQGICGNEKVCQNLEGSYTCNCKEGFQKNGDSCDDIDECSDITLNTCSVDTNCQNLYGNYTCNCKPGFQKYDSGCEVRDVCAQFPQLNCSYGCRFGERDPYKGYCFCESGFELDFDNSTCKDIDECNESSTCQHNCTNLQGSFECACTTGYSLENDGRSCKDIDECLQDSHCEHYCNNTDGSYLCSCRDGYNVVNFSKCEDIDECSTINTGVDGCQNCTNTPGSFHCSCFEGYVLNNTTMSNCTKCPEGYYGENCQEQCSCGQGSERCDHITGCYCKPGWTGTLCETDINEYIDECNELSTCQHNCTNLQGSFECACTAGYSLENDGRSCKDIDECLGDTHCEHYCNNTDGSYVCSCRDGYNLANFSKCEDIDECSTINTGVDGCQNCTNTPGSFHCSCFEGYVLNNTTMSNCTKCPEGYYGENCQEQCSCGQGSERCDHITGCYCKPGWTGTLCETDINECNSTDNPCNSYTEECINNDGSFICRCKEGFTNSANDSCKDIDECNESSTCQHNCTNLQGSFECACTTGYSLENDGRSCKDIDECLGDSHCEHYCNNTGGSYVCSCRDGFNVVNFSKCEDIDECSTIDTGIDGCQNCTNIPGSFRCSCSKGYVLNSTTLTNCNMCPNFKYGVNCSNDCACVFNNTKMCDHVTGECECSVGWTRTDCSEDIDECQNGSISCNESIFQVCVNTEGSAHCECQYGGSDISNCVPPEPSVATTQEQPKTTTPQQPESTICDNFKYGDNCSNDCACVLNNTNSCHNVTGTCDCKKEWTGTDCSVDIDECKNGLISCNESIHQVCVNTEGSAYCECQYGGTDISNCIAPKPPGIASTDEFKVKAEISFDFDHRRENILQNTDKWIVEITSQLETFYRKHVQDFTRVVFLSLRFGSVIVDHEIYSSGTEETLKVDTANSMVKLLRQDDKIVLFNRSTDVKNIILFKDNITISWTLFIIIGIVVPLGMATIVLAVVYVCQKGRSKKKSNRSITLDNNGVKDNKEDTSRGKDIDGVVI
uniref:Fibrillin-1 n=1 Tax=Magallana gigas TaxID=29159 RepID=A0A8W8N019_MAGGI